MRIFISVVSLLVVSCVSANVSEDKNSELTEYIESLDPSCLYQDGYTCIEKSDPMFYGQKAQQSILAAGYFHAWNPAYETFLSLTELTEKQKDLKHYKIGFAEEGGSMLCSFLL